MIDDLHWADASTVMMLRHMARAYAPPTDRRTGQPGPALVDAFGALRTEADLTVLHLRGRPGAAMRQLLSAGARCRNP